MTCKDCIHYEVCVDNAECRGCELIGKLCCMFKNKSRIIELPCAIGTTIYMLVTRKTTSFTYNWDKEHISKVMQRHENHHTFIKTTELMKSNLFNVIDKWNDTIFATKEEAEAKLKELNNV